MYVYAFLKPIPLDLPEGLTTSLELIGNPDLAAVVENGLAPESIRMADDRFQLQAILSHDRVLRELFYQTDVLPVPFGTFLISEDALLNHLAMHQLDYLQKLEAIAHQAEYTLKAEPAPLMLEELDETVRGKEYFLAKKRRYQQQEEFYSQQTAQKNWLLEAIAAVPYPFVCSEPKDNIERIHILCPRQSEEPLQQILNDWQAHCPAWLLSIGDALPPYHFV